MDKIQDYKVGDVIEIFNEDTGAYDIYYEMLTIPRETEEGTILGSMRILTPEEVSQLDRSRIVQRLRTVSTETRTVSY